MTDRPIIFSAPMVRALLAGRKTQTRRLATSPLRRCEVGDRLYVREHWKTNLGNDGVAPRDLDRETSILTLADNGVATRRFDAPWGKHRQGMHMPRWASRMTLIVEDVKFEPLQAISEADAIAEGIRPLPGDGPNRWTVDVDGWGISAPTAVETYELLWRWLHKEPGQRWEDNPAVVALTFAVNHRNIDSIEQG